MHIDFNHTYVDHTMNACCINAQYLSSYVCIYICLLTKIDFLCLSKFICTSKHKIMLLATLLLRIYPNYLPYGMYEIGDCLYLIVLILFSHSSYPSFYFNFV